jgi:hypothetical protein
MLSRRALIGTAAAALGAGVLEIDAAAAAEQAIEVPAMIPPHAAMRLTALLLEVGKRVPKDDPAYQGLLDLARALMKATPLADADDKALVDRARADYAALLNRTCK